MPKYNIKVNRKSYQVEVAEDTPLLWVLRDHLGLVGTKYGCGMALCGACMIHVDGIANNSCILAIADVGSSEITTIEGLSEKGDHPLQVAWNEVDVPQCGYCQAGQIMTAAALLKENPHPSDDEINRAMHGNLCRCGAYHRIKKAIKLASTKL
jgi:isoquinoline 1-oxidoreductase subunit alpha